MRRGDWDKQRWARVQQLVWGHDAGPWGARSADALRLGVELADGSRTSTAAGEGWWNPEAPQPEPPVLLQHSGGGTGGGRTLESQLALWLWPLPQGDTLDLVTEWPALDVPLSRLVLDAAALRAGAAVAELYWPDAET